jgi:Outer membrane protein beta-barrel family
VAKKLSVTGNVRVFYRASTNFPSISQLQDVVSDTNSLRVSSGNPGLTQSYTHFVSGRYSYTNSKTSKSFFANLFLQTASDYISNGVYFVSKDKDSVINNTTTLKRNTQFSKPVNVDGYKSLRTFFTYSMPLKFIKTTLNLSSGFSYSKLPGIVNYTKTITNSFTYNTGVTFASNVSEYIDFNISYNANFNNTTGYSVTKYVNQAAGIGVNLLSKKGWFIQNDVSGNVYGGLSEGFNQTFWLWNAAIGKKILKGQSGEIKLSVFDLLKQNQSITRTVNETMVQDVQTQVLQQYFMLTFTYKLKNFGSGPVRQNNFNRGDRPMMPGGGFGGNRGGDF